MVPFEPSESSKRRWPLPPSLDMSIPSLLNGGGLSKQIWRPQPQIASIHRPAYETPSLLNSGGFSNQTREPTPSQPQIASIHRPAYKTPLLLNSGGLSKQTWKTVPSQPQIASIHRPTYETRSLLDSGGFSNQTRELTPLQLQTTSIRRPLYKTPSLLDSGGFSNQTWEPTPSELQVASIHRPAYMIPSANLEKKTKPADLSPSSHRGALPREVEAFGFIQTPGLHGPTTPLTPVLNPSRHDGEIINLSDDSDDCEEQRGKKSTTTSTSTSTMNDKASIAGTAHSIVEVKSEPLTDSMMMNTILLVTVHGSPLGPVPVPFTECRDFHVLFAKLIEERGVPDDDARKIDSITTTFAWTGGEFGGKLGGIRRHKPRDWDYFRDTLRKAHEMDFDRFKGKCEVAMKLHINAL